MTTDDNLYKKIVEWGASQLNSHGFILTNNQPDNVRTTPWSHVIRFSTSTGFIYLKHTPKLLALEAPIIQILRKEFNAPVPEVIANNVELSCFLMKDAGRPLREILKMKFEGSWLYRAINQFTSMQLAVTPRVDIFLKMGVPDWRLNKIPHLYYELLLQKDLLIGDGLLEREITELTKLLPKVSDLCEKLSSYLVKETLVQPDFHDNNLLIDLESKDITLIDLGEIAISHPFFSIINFLQQIKKHHSLDEHDDRYCEIKEVCLENYKSLEAYKNLLEAFEIAQHLFPIYEALCNYRLKVACGHAQFIPPFQRQARPSAPLRKFLVLTV